LIDDKHYSIKIVEEIEAGFAPDVCFEEEVSDSASEFSEHFDELNNDEPIVDALVQDLKEVWEHLATKQTTTHSAALSDTQNNHVSASFGIQQQPGLLPNDPVLSIALNGQSSAPCVHSNGAASKVKSTKAASCSNTRKSPSISGPWSFKWIKDHHIGDVGVVFSHKRKEKVLQQRHKATHNPSLIILRRIACMSLKDRQHLICMLKKTKKKSAAPSCLVSHNWSEAYQTLIIIQMHFVVHARREIF